MNKDSDKKDINHEKNIAKKTYKSPVLMIYGNIERNTGTGSGADTENPGAPAGVNATKMP